MPNASGTIALTSQIPSLANYVTLDGIQTITGGKTFTSDLSVAKIAIANSNTLYTTTGYTTLSASNVGSTSWIAYVWGNAGGGAAVLAFNNAAQYTYTFPSVSGTIALLEETQTFTGSKTFSSLSTKVEALGIKLTTGVVSTGGYLTLNTKVVGTLHSLILAPDSTTNRAEFTFDNTAIRTYALPNASGTIALTSALSSYVPTSRILTINGTAYNLNEDRAWTITTASTYTLPNASNSVLGGIKVGSNLSIDGNGVLSSTDTNTTYANFTRSVSGLVPNPGGSSTNRYLREDGTWVVPPDTDTDTNTWNANTKDVAGYVSAPGAVANKVWKTDGNGNPGWRDDADTDTNTTYSAFTGATALVNGTAGLVIAPLIANRAQYLKGDGTWGTPPDTDTTYVAFTRSAAGLAPASGGTSGTTKYLREDGTWAVPPDTDTDTNTVTQIRRENADGTTSATAYRTGDIRLRQGANITISEVSAGIFQISSSYVDTDTNTWDANSKTVAGYVAAPGDVANKVWKTDGSGNPGWRNDADTDTTYSAGAGLTLTGTSFSVTKTITAAQTADTIALRNGDGQLVATGFYQASSRSLKTNISPFTKSALDIIRDVTVVSFNYKTDIINKHVGFIAEDTPEELSTRHKNVMDSNNTIGVLLKAVQELEARIKQLESK
jgi:hypothetical protein